MFVKFTSFTPPPLATLFFLHFPRHFSRQRTIKGDVNDIFGKTNIDRVKRREG